MENVHGLGRILPSVFDHNEIIFRTTVFSEKHFFNRRGVAFEFRNGMQKEEFFQFEDRIWGAIDTLKRNQLVPQKVLLRIFDSGHKDYGKVTESLFGKTNPGNENRWERWNHYHKSAPFFHALQKLLPRNFRKSHIMVLEHLGEDPLAPLCGLQRLGDFPVCIFAIQVDHLSPFLVVADLRSEPPWMFVPTDGNRINSLNQLPFGVDPKSDETLFSASDAQSFGEYQFYFPNVDLLRERILLRLKNPPRTNH